jgi:glycine cleavage system H protein
VNPPDLRYSEEHEWLRTEEDGIGVIGITEFAAENLGDVVFLELPEANTKLTQFQKLGEIESVKAVSDLYAPVGGSVVERNELAVDNPQLVNDGPYDSGWLLKLALSDRAEIDKLMTAEQYDAFLASQPQ